MAETTLDKLADAVLQMTEVMSKLIDRVESMDEAWRHGAYDAAYIDPDEFKRLCMDVADIERRTREVQAND